MSHECQQWWWQVRVDAETITIDASALVSDCYRRCRQGDEERDNKNVYGGEQAACRNGDAGKRHESWRYTTAEVSEFGLWSLEKAGKVW